jgi:hypothetical protein
VTTTILPDDRCPACGYVLDACTGVPSNASERPSPGDVALCFGCGEVLYFDVQMKHQLFPKLRLEGLDLEFPDLEPGQQVTVARCVPFQPGLSADLIVERLREAAFEHSGEAAEDWLSNVGAAEEKQLAAGVNTAIEAWLRAVNEWPSFYGCEDFTQHEPPPEDP